MGYFYRVCMGVIGGVDTSCQDMWISCDSAAHTLVCQGASNMNAKP